LIETLFEDDYLVIINKPPLVLSQPSVDKKRIAVKDQYETENPNYRGKLFLHHRLDFETSGVFLMSKASTINKSLTEMFSRHQFEKKYICLTRPNKIQPGKKVECEIINEKEWIIKNFMAPAKMGGGQKKRMISVKSGGWAAETKFIIQRKTEQYFCIEAIPKTGRTHQIRQHLQESFCSILGDNIYGGKSEMVPRLMLHARELNFMHPLLKKRISVVASPPKDFQKFLDI
jgi:23S rRNA pseudouridine955/2504/2580 synthase